MKDNNALSWMAIHRWISGIPRRRFHARHFHLKQVKRLCPKILIEYYTRIRRSCLKINQMVGRIILCIHMHARRGRHIEWSKRRRNNKRRERRGTGTGRKIQPECIHWINVYLSQFLFVFSRRRRRENRSSTLLHSESELAPWFFSRQFVGAKPTRHFNFPF